MKKLAFLGLTLLLLFVCALCACAQNGDVRIVDHVVYQLETADGESSWTVVSLFDSKKAKQTVKEITIREEIDGIPVYAIKPTASWDEGPDGEPIWDPAAPDYFVSADDAACESITIPPSVKTIGAFSFPCMTRLQSVLLPDSVEEIGAYAFCNCTALREIRLPASLRTIGRNAFNRCATLEAVRIPDGVTTLGSSSFAMCGQLSDVQFGAGLKTIGDNAFGACAKLTALEQGVFADCAKLERIALPDTLRTVCRDAFLNTAIVELTVPAACGTFWFNGMAKLKQVTLEDRTGKLTIPGSCFSGLRALEQVTLPKSAKVTIGSGAFARCVRLTKIQNGGAIVSVRPKAFYGCKALPALTLSGRLRRLDGSALLHCDSLSKLRFTGTSAAFLSADSDFLQTLPESCKLYVRTNAMKQAFVAKGCTNKVIVKHDLA